MAEITLAAITKELKGSPVYVSGTTKGAYRVVVEVPTLVMAVATARAFKEAIEKLDKIKVTWRNRILAASKNGRMHAIVRCILGHNSTDGGAQFHGKASITSDGFIMCDFLDQNYEYHHGAFVGSVSEFRENAVGIADFIGLEGTERDEWFAACRAWISDDYSGSGLGL